MVPTSFILISCKSHYRSGAQADSYVLVLDMPVGFRDVLIIVIERQ